MNFDIITSDDINFHFHFLVTIVTISTSLSLPKFLRNYFFHSALIDRKIKNNNVNKVYDKIE